VTVLQGKMMSLRSEIDGGVFLWGKLYQELLRQSEVFEEKDDENFDAW
jgi:hypothetical protein